MKQIISVLFSFIIVANLQSQSKAKKTTTPPPPDLRMIVDKMSSEIEGKIIEDRHWLHQNAELSNREFKTSEYIAKYLKSIGIEPQVGIAKTGVVGLIKGGKPGPTILLRADIDGLPVTERVDLSWKSTNKDVFNGMGVGVMHACGHDTHIAMLMGAAKILYSMRDQLKGNIKLVFQPAEEGAPIGEEGGAELMIKEGVMDNPKVDVAFGLHINSMTPVGHINYKPEGTMAAVNGFSIKIKGKQVHGSTPWDGIDPVVVGAQIVMGLQTIVSRQTELTKEAAVVTVAMFHGGVRNNIIPEEVELGGTIRTLDKDMQEKIHEKIELTATKIAESMGATAKLTIHPGYPLTYNDPALTEQMVPTLKRVLGDKNVHLIKAVTGAEDFSFFGLKVPSLFLFLGGMPAGADRSKAPAHHTPDFYVDDSAMSHGIKTLCNLVLDYGDSWKTSNTTMTGAPSK